MAAPLPFPLPPAADLRDVDEKISDAKSALACLEDVLLHVPVENLHLLRPSNLAAFLRVIQAQLPD